MKMIRNNNAVSPVIGVMLMLVVTVILAAAVSSYSGGLVDDNSKASQLAIKADYSQTKGMTITHMGGDIVNTLDTKVIVSTTKDFGMYDQLRWEVDTANISISKDKTPKPWFDPTKTSSNSARTFQPGEVAYVEYGNKITFTAGYPSASYTVGDVLMNVQPTTYTTAITDSYSSFYGFENAGNIGQRFVLSLVDGGGRTIAQTEVVIQP